MELKTVYYKDLPEYGLIKSTEGIEVNQRLVLDEDEIDESLFNLFHNKLMNDIYTKHKCGVLWSYFFENEKKFWVYEIIPASTIDDVMNFKDSEESILQYENIKDLEITKVKRKTFKYKITAKFNSFINWFKSLFSKKVKEEVKPPVEEDDDMMTMINKIPDEDILDLDITFATFMLPRLAKFQLNMNDFPEDFETLEEWHEVIDTMIFSLSVISDSLDFEEGTDDYENYKLGMENFAKYCNWLWFPDSE